MGSILVFILLTTNFGCSKIEDIATQCIEGVYELSDGLQIEVQDGNFAIVIGKGDSKLTISNGDLFIGGIIQTGQNEYEGFVRSQNGGGGLTWGNLRLRDNELTITPVGGSSYTLLQTEKRATSGGSTPPSGGGSGSTGGGGGSSNCTSKYVSASKDVQLDSFCALAYAYRCLDNLPLTNPKVNSACATYEYLRLSNAPDCPYCK